MKIQHSPEVIAQLEANAIGTPHGLFITDRILQIDVAPFNSTITFAHSPPNGAINPVATIQMSTPMLKALAEAIQKELADRTDEINAALTAFQQSLNYPR